jgi:photosystem II stability/assembly factor-like uncharacterized protein
MPFPPRRSSFAILPEVVANPPLLRVALIALLALAASFAGTNRVAAAAVPESSYAELRWRLVGPFRGGWATAVAGIPGEPATFLFGGADGGVWKTTDAGVTWSPIFDRGRASSIGALAIAPSDPKVLWIGTGQVHQRWDVVSGEGIFRSTDGGATWQAAGLADSRHIGKIWVDPGNPEVAVVAALGHLFGPGGERGLYRTENGGKTWTRVLFHDDDTGAVEIVGDPAHPERLYAALWQVRRHPWMDYFQPTQGSGSAVYGSTDGGRTWSAGGRSGWPEGDLGRIALAVAPGSSGLKVWAAVSGKGLFVSGDGGATWSLANADGSLANGYMANLAVDPRDPAVLWAMGRGLRRSTDSGKTFTIAKGAPGGDDYHMLWIDPENSRRMITGADQGAVVTLNGGDSWSSWYNQPTGQFYRLATDRRFPYWIYSGQQDSGTVAIASRSDYGQLTYRDWHPVGGDERDADIPDPRDPDIVYGAGLGGRLSKWNARTGEVQNVSPWPIPSYGARPGTSRYRYSWITPIAISPRPPHAIYQGAQVLFRSLDSGATWATISPDLTGADAVASGSAACRGDVSVELATRCGFGVIFAIAPSPAADGLVWIGTDNGRIQLTRDDGASWRDVTPPGLGDWSKVNTVDAAAGDPATAYVAADRHRRDDLRPVAFRTHDFGATWTDIAHGLPQDEWLGALRHDPKRPGLLYAGTNRGVHVSFDDGESWQSLQLNLPTTGINDLVVAGDDIVVATQGRAIWALDVVEPLRHLAGIDATKATLLPPAAAVRLRFNQYKDTPLPPEEPRAANPPVGAVLDYILPAPSGGPVTLEIRDAAGALVRRFASDESPERPREGVYFTAHWLADANLPATGAGHHRFVWDLRRERPRALDYDYSIAAIPGRETPPAPAGALVSPGSYEVRLTVGGTTERQSLTVVADPRVDRPASDYAAIAEVQADVARLLADSATLEAAIGDLERRLAAVPLANGGAPVRWVAEARRQLAGVRGEESPVALNGRLAGLAADLESGDAAATGPQREVLASCRGDLERVATRWREFERRELPRLRDRLARPA